MSSRSTVSASEGLSRSSRASSRSYSQPQRGPACRQPCPRPIHRSPHVQFASAAPHLSLHTIEASHYGVAVSSTLSVGDLLLRPFRAEDRDAIGRYADSETYLRNLGPGFPNAEAMVEHNLACGDDPNELGWVIERDGEVVGSVFLGIDRTNATGHLACLIAPDAWRQGVARASAMAVMDHGFTVERLEKIWARSEAGNAGSIRAMESLGMRLEGTLRSHRATREGGRCDEVIYGILATDWPSS